MSDTFGLRWPKVSDIFGLELQSASRLFVESIGLNHAERSATRAILDTERRA